MRSTLFGAQRKGMLFNTTDRAVNWEWMKVVWLRGLEITECFPTASRPIGLAGRVLRKGRGCTCLMQKRNLSNQRADPNDDCDASLVRFTFKAARKHILAIKAFHNSRCTGTFLTIASPHNAEAH